MKHILYLPSWFPNRRDPFPGDFILRHAIAASLFNSITVFCTIPDTIADKPEMTEQIINENLKVYLYYYPAKQKIYSSVFNGIKRWNALRNFYRQHFKQAPPDIVHVHVAWPAGLFALYLQKRFGLKYIQTEHETIYMPGYDNTRLRSGIERSLLPRIFKKANYVHTVSHALGEALMNLKLVTRFPEVIPNVVDTALFYPGKKKSGNVYRFIHISGLTFQKNPEGMLEAFAEVKNQRNDFLLTILGPANEKIRKLAYQLSLQDNINFKGEVAYPAVADEIRNSDAMIHFSRYETFGCVVAESLCCGVPVITSDLPVTRELVTDGINGLLVKEGDSKDLAEKILQFMNGSLQIDQIQISEDNRGRFNYERVGKEFDKLYNQALQSTP